MRNVIILTLFTIFLMHGCSKQETGTIIEPIVEKDEYAISLAVGNEYLFRHSFSSNTSPYSTTWFTSKKIIADTLIGNEKYSVFDDGLLLRSEKETVYYYDEDLEKIYFTFEISMGDTIIFENDRYTLVEIRETNEFFGETGILFTISNEIFNPDSLVKYSLMKKFGLVHSFSQDTSTVYSYVLTGAMVDGKTYGRL